MVNLNIQFQYSYWPWIHISVEVFLSYLRSPKPKPKPYGQFIHNRIEVYRSAANPVSAVPTPFSFHPPQQHQASPFLYVLSSPSILRSPLQASSLQPEILPIDAGTPPSVLEPSEIFAATRTLRPSIQPLQFPNHPHHPHHRHQLRRLRLPRQVPHRRP